MEFNENLLLQTQSRLSAQLEESPLEQLEPGLYVKKEFLLPTSSFKIRPAWNGLLSLPSDVRKKGVITSSSGNFAQAVAFAARQLEVPATIVMTKSTSPLKIEKTKQLGATVVMCEPTFESRWGTTKELQEKTGQTLLHPYDSVETVLANATIGLEIIKKIKGPSTIIVPVSGGGLIAGIAWAVKNLRSGIRVLGVQPEGVSSMNVSLRNGVSTRVTTSPSIADALVAPEPGKLGFELAKRFVDGVELVSDREMSQALAIAYSRWKLVIEPAAAATLAVYLRSNRDISVPTVCVLSGANISEKRHAELMALQ